MITYARVGEGSYGPEGRGECWSLDVYVNGRLDRRPWVEVDAIHGRGRCVVEDDFGCPIRDDQGPGDWMTMVVYADFELRRQGD